MRGTDLSGPSRLVTRSKDIHLENVTGDLQVETTNGDIEVHAADKLPLGTNRPLPANTATSRWCCRPMRDSRLQATTSKGDITSEFDAAEDRPEQRRSARAIGTVGNGVSKLQINTDTGDIRITKG